MFEIDIIEKKGILNTLLAVNTDMLFMNGAICSLHKHGMCMAMYEDDNIEVEDEYIVNDMAELENVLRSTTVTSALFNPEAGRIVVERPYKWLPTIPRLRNEKYIKDVKRHLRNLKKLRKAKKMWEDRHGRKHKVARFSIDNHILGDAIRRLGAPESTELRTGNSLRIRNMRSNAKTILPVEAPKVKIYLSKDGRGLLLNSLIGEDSSIVIANKVVMLIENDIKMILAGRIPEK